MDVRVYPYFTAGDASLFAEPSSLSDDALGNGYAFSSSMNGIMGQSIYGIFGASGAMEDDQQCFPNTSLEFDPQLPSSPVHASRASIKKRNQKSSPTTAFPSIPSNPHASSMKSSILKPVQSHISSHTTSSLMPLPVKQSSTTNQSRGLVNCTRIRPDKIDFALSFRRYLDQVSHDSRRNNKVTLQKVYEEWIASLQTTPILTYSESLFAMYLCGVIKVHKNGDVTYKSLTTSAETVASNFAKVVPQDQHVELTHVLCRAIEKLRSNQHSATLANIRQQITDFLGTKKLSDTDWRNLTNVLNWSDDFRNRQVLIDGALVQTHSVAPDALESVSPSSSSLSSLSATVASAAQVAPILAPTILSGPQTIGSSNTGAALADASISSGSLFNGAFLPPSANTVHHHQSALVSPMATPVAAASSSLSSSSSAPASVPTCFTTNITNTASLPSSSLLLGGSSLLSSHSGSHSNANSTSSTSSGASEIAMVAAVRQFLNHTSEGVALCVSVENQPADPRRKDEWLLFKARQIQRLAPSHIASIPLHSLVHYMQLILLQDPVSIAPLPSTSTVATSQVPQVQQVPHVPHVPHVNSFSFMDSSSTLAPFSSTSVSRSTSLDSISTPFAGPGSWLLQTVPASHAFLTDSPSDEDDTSYGSVDLASVTSSQDDPRRSLSPTTATTTQHRQSLSQPLLQPQALPQTYPYHQSQFQFSQPIAFMTDYPSWQSSNNSLFDGSLSSSASSCPFASSLGSTGMNPFTSTTTTTTTPDCLFPASAQSLASQPSGPVQNPISSLFSMPHIFNAKF
eukprot:TRINITY_DN102_c0_g1_i15.p1 TRINITY_DN102_c0_g1~~TRINITY_DN102_c0_g1_i15.p1  ORF type:complete len:797 (-),score=172.78 TRINITY_DN102_c0_g1_i15:1091-3481(-)